MGRRLGAAIVVIMLLPTMVDAIQRISVRLRGHAVYADESGVSSGDIVLRLSGSCGAGFTEVTSLDGFMLRGTTSANADAGQSGGTDAITPAGSVSTPTFSGDALAGHAHATGTYAASAHSGTAVADHASHTHTYTEVPNHVHPYASQTATTGSASSYEHGAIDASSAAAEASITTNNPTGGVATGTTNGPSATLTHSVTQPSAHTLSGSSESVSGGTPAGTVSQPTFTGTQFDNKPAFKRVILCQKD